MRSDMEWLLICGIICAFVARLRFTDLCCVKLLERITRSGVLVARR